MISARRDQKATRAVPFRVLLPSLIPRIWQGVMTGKLKSAPICDYPRQFALMCAQRKEICADLR
jgi:hypothetical protein